MEPVKVGLIGLGWWGSELLRGAEAAGDIELVTCFARTPETRVAFAAERGIKAADSVEELVNDADIEAVIVATPHNAHVEQVTAALGAGKHVFVDKPFAMSADGARRCIAAAEEAGKVLQVGHQRRRQAPTRRIKEMIDSGELGSIIALEANYSAPGSNRTDDNWRFNPEERPLSGLTPFGVHVIDSFQYLVGPITAVSAISNRPFGKTALDDGAILTFRFANGAIGTLLTSTTVPSTNRVGVMGTEGAAWNDLDGERLLIQPVGDRSPTEHPVDQNDTIAEQMREFAANVRSGATPEVDGAAGFRVTAVLEAALRSAQTGKMEDVEQL